MGKEIGASSNSGAAAAATSTTVPPAVKVSPYDGASMKRTLDDNIVEIFTTQTNLDVDYKWFDIKLAVMFVACVAGCIAQFYPAPFPENRTLLAICVVIYFALSGYLQYAAWYIDKDYIFESKPQKAGGPSVCLRTQMAKFDDKYVVIVEQPRGKEIARMTQSVGEFFSQDGHFSPEHFARALETHISAVINSSRGKKDK